MLWLSLGGWQIFFSGMAYDFSSALPALSLSSFAVSSAAFALLALGVSFPSWEATI